MNNLYHEAATVTAFPPTEALRLGADVALVSLTLETGSEANDAHNVAVFRELCGAAQELGMPVVGEYFPVADATFGSGENAMWNLARQIPFAAQSRSNSISGGGRCSGMPTRPSSGLQLAAR
jgi:DhnA family fructose-bisphosphate aldolase class Ia